VIGEIGDIRVRGTATARSARWARRIRAEAARR